MALSGAKYEEKDNLAALFDIPEARIWVIAKKTQNKTNMQFAFLITLFSHKRFQSYIHTHIPRKIPKSQDGSLPVYRDGFKINPT